MTQQNGTQLVLDGPFAGNGGRTTKFAQRLDVATEQATVGNVASSIFVLNQHAPLAPDNYTCGQFVGIQSLPGGGDSFTLNVASYVGTGVATSTNHIGVEIDQHNGAGDAGNNLFSFAIPHGVSEVSPLKLVGVGGTDMFRTTSAILAYSLNGPVFNRGLALVGNSVIHADIQTETNATYVLLGSGSHTYGIDLSRCTGMAAALMVPNNATISFGLSGGGSSPIVVGTDNELRIGENAAAIRLRTNAVLPSSDNTLAFGQPGARVGDVYAVNIRPGDGAVKWTSGAGSPEGVVVGPVGSLFTRTDGGAGTTLYIKESGSGATGWVGK